jgi:hypothetical protein
LREKCRLLPSVVAECELLFQFGREGGRAPGFLLLIGAALITRGFGFHFPKGYIYAAMAFSGALEDLDMPARRRRKHTARMKWQRVATPL